MFNLTEHEEREQKALDRQAALKRLEELEAETAQLNRFKKLAETSTEAAELLRILEG